MKYSELQAELQNLTGKNVTLSAIAEVLGITKQNLNYNVKNSNRDVSEDDILLIEQYYNVSLVDKVILDFYPDIFGSCGNGVFALSDQKEQIIVPKKAFFTSYNPIKKYSVITARGNSMEPLIFDNDKLIIEHSTGEQIIDNKPYIFCYNDEIFIKRLAKNVNQLIITSENANYDVVKLSDDEINKVLIIGQVVGLMRDLR